MSETFSVPEMSCDHCKSTVEGAVAGLSGVRSAAVSLDDKTVTVDYDTGVLDRYAIVGAIEEAGYQVT